MHKLTVIIVIFVFLLPHQLSNDIMGEGEFGPVVKGIARHIKEEESETLVAIKVLMSREGEETLWPSLMDFANQMRLSSPYVAKILGLCADSEPYYVIYEYLDRVSGERERI